MDYQQFIHVVEKEVRENVKKDVRVCIHTVIKNNGKERKGLTLSEQGINISPTIYLEEYYEKFRNGKSVKDIINHILELYEEVRFQRPWEVSCVQEYENIKSKVVYKLIGREKNAQMLEEVPYIPVLDLAMVFYVILELSEHGTATMMIRKENLKAWGIEEKTLREQAEQNTPKILPAKFSTMKSVIAEMTGEKEEEEGEDDMYVLSNCVRNYGACCILYPNVLEQIGCRLQENYYVLPSSVHEVIIIPESKSPDKDDLEVMIREINETQVSPEEVLSDLPYYYHRGIKKMIV